MAAVVILALISALVPTGLCLYSLGVHSGRMPAWLMPAWAGPPRGILGAAIACGIAAAAMWVIVMVVWLAAIVYGQPYGV